MEYTVGDLLKIDVLKRAVYIGKEESLENAVTGITVIDSPDISLWVKGGEVILTSFYPIKGMSDSEMRMWMNDLADQQISVLMTKVPKAFQEIPESILDVCMKRGIPIISIPTEVAFTEVTYPVMGMLINKQVERLTYFKEVHTRFTELSLQNVGSKKLIEALAEILGNPVTLYNEFFQKIDTTDPKVELFYDLDQKLEEEKRFDTKFPFYKRSVIFPLLQEIEREQIIVPIRTIDRTELKLVIHAINQDMRPYDYIAIEHAATALSLELIKQIAISEVEKKYKNDLIDDLLLGKISTMDRLYGRVGIANIDVEAKYVVVIFTIQPNPSRKTEEGSPEKQRELQKNDAILTDTIHFYLNDSIIRNRIDKTIVLWKINKRTTNEKVPLKNMRKTIGHIKEKFNKTIDGYFLQVGIGGISSSILDLDRSYQEAQDALHIGNSYQGKKEFILAFQELGIYRLLYQFDDVNQLKTFIPTSLQKLIDYKKSNRTDLLRTLTVYLQKQQNIRASAEELFVHDKTVSYRLERIKEITGMNFTDAEEMLSVQVGLRIIDLLVRDKT